ncbi:hypothetical protein PT974_06937 [Cladobotryum mycophilum]|uniref:ubiquitinyl hydrolase 1 n=1 Tax=Cladobotryum mycophilum TaxID=491253 RepID=A0ABR0SMW0_9HYPO
MALVTLELWIAADKAATYTLPLLKEYEHEIPIEVLQALLLGLRGDMERLYHAENYLKIRRDNARPKDRPSIFVSYGHRRSFPVEYFSQSLLHQDLLHKIESWAHEQRELKREEFRRLYAEYESLIQRYEQGVCQYNEWKEEGIPYSRHSPYCSRCALHNVAMGMSIAVHEWPLSSDPLEAQATVFELALPNSFGTWWDATIYVIDNVLRSKRLSDEEAPSSYPLRSYSGLARFFQSDFGLRVHLLSSAKPHIITHRRDRKVGVSAERDVCVNNGLRLRYFDDHRERFLDRFATTTRLSELCTFKLDSNSTTLQRFLLRTHEEPAGETPNAVVASQATCPEHMSLGEFKALATLPFGYRIQWMSVLTQLAMPDVSFNKFETAIFFLQVSLQVGPNNIAIVERCAHKRLADAEFGHVMLEHLQRCVSCIKENWESNTALWIFTFLAVRLLSMTSQELRGQILDLLKECRMISYQWLKKLRSRAQETKDEDEDQRIQFLRIALRVSLICADSFNVDDEFLALVLSDPEQSAILLEASINIYNNTGLLREKQDLLERIIYDRWMLILHRARPILEKEVLINSNPCLDLTITRCWPAFRREIEWHIVPPTCNWFETKSGHQKVHVNILTGELLVDGSPLSRLPREYEIHEDYQKIFGSFVLDVMPSTLQGMRFCSCKTFEDYAVHFGMQGHITQEKHEKDLLIRLQGGGCPTMDLVPSRFLNQLLPHSFVKDYIHWYNHDTDSIELCPIGDSWRPSKENWVLRQHGNFWKLTHLGRTSLLAPKSRSARLIAAILSPLDPVLNIHMLLDEKSKDLEIKVSSLQLEFHLRCGESVIRSRQFRGMQVDANQSMGTLVGFASKLVMRDSHKPEVRMVIIPEGEINFGRDSSIGHVRATVNYGTARRVQRYLIDSQLRRLVDNATVQSKLFLAYIHALTSYCIPDPFLGRTGTEEALSILQSASIRSIDNLAQDSVKVLLDIASLTPRRAFYPEHLRTMQKVDWCHELSFVTQDSRFYKIVNRILDRVSVMSFLYPSDTANTKDDVVLMHADFWLVEREIVQNSRYQVSNYGAEEFASTHDIEYASRDRRISSQVVLASETAIKVYNSIGTIERPVDNGLMLDLLYTHLSHKDGTPAIRNMPRLQEMEYGAAWLEDPQAFLSAYWCRLHYAFQTSKQWMNKFQVMIWLTTLAYSSKCNTHVLQALRILSLSAPLSASRLPEALLYFLAEGYTVKKNQLDSIVKSAGRRFHDKCPEMSIRRHYDESYADTQRRRENSYLTMRRDAFNSFVDELVQQWPCATPSQPRQLSYQSYIDVSSAMDDVKAKWKVWYENYLFREYLQEFVHRLSETKKGSTDHIQISHLVYQSPAIRPQGFISVGDVFSNLPPRIVKEEVSLDLTTLLQTSSTNDEASNKLNELLHHLKAQAKFDFERQYLSELRCSLKNLQDRKVMQLNENFMSMRAMVFEVHLEQCKTRVQDTYDKLCEAVLPSQALPHQISDGRKMVDSIALAAGFWPRLSPTFFLQQLGRNQWLSLTDSWKKAITAYGLAITAFQQAQRLVQLENNEIDLLREIENGGHKAWDPCQYPEWLLLECESGIIIRDVQHQIAEQMIAPENNGNAVMQLNMGEGKSSVIVPIAATALSNGSQIVRVIVAKPQAKQMHQMLVSKLSGLLDRPIFRMPFSRAIRMDAKKASIVHELALRCMSEGGVMMVQPEHLLSFQLMGLECQIDGNDEVAQPLLAVQQLFDKSSRDIVDESDENFSVKFELIYTIGLQRPIEHTPDRWVVIQEVLARFALICSKLKNSFPESIDIDDRHPERFPRMRILGADAEWAILSSLADSICSTGMTGVFWDDITVNYILLLRGLFSGGILAFAFGQKRWRVDYGTDPNRDTKTLLAVPFRAKDNPTPRSEFSHPDVVILLTCLSYYYSGLKNGELFESLDLLIRSDSADLEYHAWVKTAPQLPHAFRQLTCINIRDRVQCVKEIFPKLRYSKGAIDYFLSRMVFAKESREFPHKLSASGWDLGKTKTNPTTGFSGTNDSRYVLPVAIRQLDLPEQNHTNAPVLKYLLRPENGIRLMPKEMTAATLESDSLLKMMLEIGPNARVILDVGAQIIDLNNLQFAKKWLESYKDKDQVQAVVFFSDVDELTVVDKSGKVEPLQISPFATQLDQCLVFLDEAHTRGTDLRMPEYYQAAVTLGANLTKDKLVQACMRMRKLGKGQSVVFCIPREIEQKILMQQRSELLATQKITVSDVLYWTISETWRDLQRTVPLWLTQGVRFYEQDAFWKQSTDSSGSDEKTEWAKQFLEDEAQSLDFRYRPRAGLESAQLIQRAGPAMRLEFQRRCEEFGLKDFRSSALQEEQERELSPETERERQVEPIPQVEPQKHSCHADLVHFIERGEFPTNFTTFKTAFQALGDTSAARHFDVREFHSSIWVTEDFSRTVRMNRSLNNCTDLFQRPVHWILTRNDPTNSISQLVIISPWEAHQLLGKIETCRNVTLRLYAPRNNLGFKPLDKLTLYTVPLRKKKPVLPHIMMVELNIFAGQLYLSSFQEYVQVCDKLGLAWSAPDDSVILGPDGFIPPGIIGGHIVNKSGFMKSPVQFLKVLITKIRRNCEVIERTHIGKVLDGVLLVQDDFRKDD